MAGTCILPVDILRDDPYFSKEKHVFSRAEALAWIAANVRYVDNCTLKKWQESWSLRYLANAWGWTVKRVRCFLKACENRGFIRTSLGHIKGTAQIVITYMVQRLNWSSDEEGAQVGAQQGHSKGTNKGGKETQEKKEDSPYSPPEGDEDPMAGLEPQPQRPAGAGPSKSPPDPQTQAAPDDKAVTPEKESKGSAPQPEVAIDGNYPQEFNLLWDTLPKRRDGKGCVKKQAYKRWRQLTRAQKDRAQAGAVLLKKQYEGKSKEYAPGKTNWIRNDCWDDILDVKVVDDDDEDNLVGEMGSRIIKNAKGESCLIF